MAAVRQRDTEPELALRRALFSCGLRFRRGFGSKLPGRPDIVFPRAKVAVFVDGCFWHSCPLHGSYPRQNASFWATKLTRNVCRDRENDSALRELSWEVVRVWEHEIEEDCSIPAQAIWAIVRSRS